MASYPTNFAIDQSTWSSAPVHAIWTVAASSFYGSRFFVRVCNVGGGMQYAPLQYSNLTLCIFNSYYYKQLDFGELIWKCHSFEISRQESFTYMPFWRKNPNKRVRILAAHTNVYIFGSTTDIATGHPLAQIGLCSLCNTGTPRSSLFCRYLQLHTYH